MKTTLFAAAFACVASFACAEPHYVMETPTGYLNMRSGPGAGHSVIAKLLPHKMVASMAERGNWLHVRSQTGQTGWVAERFLYTHTNFDGETLKVQQTLDGFLNVREGPGTQHAVKGRVTPDEYVTVLQSRGKWLRVQLRSDSSLGWVRSRYVN